MFNDNEIYDVSSDYNYLNLINTIIKALYYNNKLNRLFLNIISSNNINTNNELVLLHNPSIDNHSTNNKITQVYKYHIANNNNLTTIINLFSSVIQFVDKTNYETILNENSNKNINAIEELIKENNYSRCIIGCGQHLFNNRFNKKCK